MCDCTPTAEQISLLAHISMNLALPLEALRSGDLEADLRRSIDIIDLVHHGHITYSQREQVVRCTPRGRVWVRAHVLDSTRLNSEVLH